MRAIRSGDAVRIRPEWQDAGDETFMWIAVSDEEKGRLDIAPMGTGLAIPPVYTVRRDMIEQASLNSEG